MLLILRHKPGSKQYDVILLGLCIWAMQTELNREGGEGPSESSTPLLLMPSIASNQGRQGRNYVMAHTGCTKTLAKPI